jgi:phage/plasmid-like protein (TIGR03299 family)
MSAETSQWLNTQTLIGLTDKRGNAWHYRAEDQGNESNHYGGFIPVADVERRLFNWEPGERNVAVVLQGFREDALTTYMQDGTIWSVVAVEGQKAVTRDDSEQVLGVFTDGYQPHSYHKWLVENIGSLLSTAKDEVGIGSAGLLRKGGQAWVQVQVPEAIEVGGTMLLPYLTAATSLDGSLSTTYFVGSDVVVCDNTLSAATLTAHNMVKFRHSRYSALRLGEARQELDILFAATDDMISAIDRLQNVSVSSDQFGKVRNLMDPMPEDPNGTKRTRWDNRQSALVDLWRNDERVAPWAGTAWGVLMAYNTHQQHVGSFRRTKLTENRGQRNMAAAISGKFEQDDSRVLQTLATVLEAPLPLIGSGV